ncbi:hypothetical protein ACHAW6_014004, partial [Cyclotella cf. meneghiniana]
LRGKQTQYSTCIRRTIRVAIVTALSVEPTSTTDHATPTVVICKWSQRSSIKPYFYSLFQSFNSVHNLFFCRKCFISATLNNFKQLLSVCTRGVWHIIIGRFCQPTQFLSDDNNTTQLC